MRRLHFLVMACALAAGGCVLPCTGGACNAKGRLWEPPCPRFAPTETPIASTSKAVCPTPYLTFSKYWPGLDEWSTKHTATSAANRILLSHQLTQFRLLNSHYKDGFRQAFIDIANGGSGECPPVPPPKYWNTFYRAQCGEKYAEDWFSGYRAGAAAANIQVGSLRTVHASYDWQVPERKKFAGEDQCVNGGCSTGQCDPRVGARGPSHFVCRPGMGMMGDSPQIPINCGPMPMMPQVPQTPGFDPQMLSMPQPMGPQPQLPSYGIAPGYGPMTQPPTPAIAPQVPIGPGYSAATTAPTATAPSFNISPGYSGSSAGPTPYGPAPQFGPSQNSPAPGHSSGGSSAWTNPPPSRIPPEGPVF